VRRPAAAVELLRGGERRDDLLDPLGHAAVVARDQVLHVARGLHLGGRRVLRFVLAVGGGEIDDDRITGTTPTVWRPSMENVPSLYGSPACAAACRLAMNGAPAIRSPTDSQDSSLTRIGIPLFLSFLSTQADAIRQAGRVSIRFHYEIR